MKALIIGNQTRYEKFLPDNEFVGSLEKIYCPMGTSDEEIIRMGEGVQFLGADAMARVSRDVIEGLPDLKIIHSEGVGYNGIDVAAAKEKDIYVCNCKAVNADAVAEHTVLLMLAALRTLVVGHKAVLAAKQIQRKEKLMVEGITELCECKIGLVGFGDIAKQTAKRLSAFGCPVYYYATSKKGKDVEEEFHVQYMELDEMMRTCDIISIHVPVTPETTGMIDDTFFDGMKESAYLINTARGEIVDTEALVVALEQGKIAGAALDTLYPEPVTPENPLLHLSEEAAEKLILSPHTAGITTRTFKKAHAMLWQGFEDVANGKEPKNNVW